MWVSVICRVCVCVAGYFVVTWVWNSPAAFRCFVGPLVYVCAWIGACPSSAVCVCRRMCVYGCLSLPCVFVFVCVCVHNLLCMFGSRRLSTVCLLSDVRRDLRLPYRFLLPFSVYCH